MIIPSYCLKLLRIFLLLFSPSTLTSSRCWTYPPPPPCPPARSSSLGSRRRGGTSSPTWSTGCTSYPHLGHQLGQHCQQPGNLHHVEPSAQLDNPQREQLCVKSATTCLRLPKTSRRDTTTNSQPGQGRHVAHFYLVYNKLYFLTKL